MTDGPVSAQVVALDHDEMMREAAILQKIASNVCVKVPLTITGLKTCKALSGDGCMVNVTLCFSATRHCLQPRREQPSYRPLSADSMTTVITECN